MTEFSPLLSAGMWVWTGPLKNLIDQVWVPAALRGGSLDGPWRCAALCGERPAAGVGGDPLHDAGQTVQAGVPLRLQAACDQNQVEQLLTEPGGTMILRKEQGSASFSPFPFFSIPLLIYICVFNFPTFGFEIFPGRNLRIYLLNLKILIWQTFFREKMSKKEFHTISSCLTVWSLWQIAAVIISSSVWMTDWTIKIRLQM